MSVMQLLSSYSLRSPSFEKSKFSSKHILPESASYCFILQIPASPRLLKLAADIFFLIFSSLPISLLSLFEENILEYSFYDRFLKLAADIFFLVFSSLPISLLSLFEENVLEYSFYEM
jgi:hypothetical protein